MLTASGLDERPEFESSVAFRVTCFLLLLWWLAYFYPVLPLEDIQRTLSEASEATAAGSMYNQAVIFGFAFLGLAWMPHAAGLLRTRRSQALVLLLALYCCWSIASVYWSEDRSLSIRRLISFFCVLTGSVGLGAGFYARTRDGVLTLARHVFIATLAAVFLLIASRLSHSSVAELLDPRWSLKESTRISAWTYPAGYAAVASLFLFQGRNILRFAAVAFFIFVMVVLKGRTMLGDAVASVLLVYSRIAEYAPVRAACLASGSALTLILTDLLTGGHVFLAGFFAVYDAVAGWLPYFSIGDGVRNITTLSGRVPLWQAIYTFILHRPLAGHGFGAFWTPTRFEEIFAAAGWRATVAHNGFLDELLATGIVGLACFLAFWLFGMYAALRQARESGGPFAPGYLVFGWLFLFLLFNGMDSILQTFFQFPTFASLLGLFALVNTPQPERNPAEIEQLFSEPFYLEEVVS